MEETAKQPNHGAIVVFKPSGQVVEVQIGTLLSDAAVEAGLSLNLPCGGQGRCGRCRVKVEHGDVSHRSAARLTTAERQEGWALGCQAVIKGDAVIFVPEQEQVEIEFVTKTVGAERIALAADFKGEVDPSVRRAYVAITPPSLDDQTTDWDRLLRALSLEHGIREVGANLATLRDLARDLREAEWSVTAVLDMGDPERDTCARPRLIDLLPGDQTGRCYGVAIDIGTTSNVVYLVDLVRGKVIDRASAYSGQIQAGEDVISRIVFAQKRDGLNRLQKMVLKTLNGLLEELTSRNQIPASQISKAVVAGNTTMIQLFLALDPKTIREMPFIPTIGQPMAVTAEELGLAINPRATVDCLPVVGAYVGADITAGVLASGMHETDALTLFIDVGTNGEIVLGNRDWLITCACSAGPAFEGSGVRHGMRATAGAIEEVWIDARTYEPTYETIGNLPARGIAGSGMIGLLADMFITGIVDKAGKIARDLPTPRVRVGDHGGEYVVVWANQSGIGTDIVINEVDIENLLRTKGAIYAGFTVLVQSVGVELADVEQVFIAGAFGQYINIEKAIHIGLLPDMPWDRFHYLGNTSALGAFHSLVSRAMRHEVFEIAQKMTYLELSADNTFYDRFMSALFLPHTDITAFPSVMRLLKEREG
ncbi:MAG: ASKHA domain-containing protein [Anaerolineae bacterium]|nr:ASKHA domain-containing protein [Anaerolineae bacterium]